MLRTIILLTDVAQHHHALSSLLREHNPCLSFCSDADIDDLALIEPRLLQDSRLISFASDTRISAEVLQKLGYGAYRFYSAPIQYPGLDLTEQEDDAHCISVIAQSIDNVPEVDRVVGLETFTIPAGTDRDQRNHIAFVRLAHLFWRLSYEIACETKLNSIHHASAGSRH